VETVTISLNGREVAGPPGTTILDLARQVGVEIPTLCHHPLLKNAGACRVCLVEDAKSGRLLASCVTPISQGMEILTDSSNAVAARRGVLELILSDHPSACVVCSKGNKCILRSLAKEHGICDPDLDPMRRWRPVEEVNPFIVRDLTKCVLCGRCIRMCKDFEAVGAIEYTDRGYESRPGTAGDTPLEGSECNFCGSCVSVCPTDALAERDRLSTSSGESYAAGICSFCGTGCSLDYELSGAVIAGATGVADSPVNGPSLCVCGRYGQDALSSPARLTDPQIRNQEGNLVKSSWDESLEVVAGILKEIVQQHGPSSVGLITGTACSNEEFYLAARLARATLRTPHVDSTARLSSGPVVEGLVASTGRIRTGASLERILDAQTICLIGARPDYTHPVVARNVRRAVRDRGATLIQFDPLKTSLSSFARFRFRDEISSLPGLMVQFMKELVACGLQDTDFLSNQVEDSEQLLSALRTDAAEIREDVRHAVGLMSAGGNVVFLLGPLVAGSTNSYLLSRLVANLAFLLGQPESLFFLFQGCNEPGAREMGCVANRLPGDLSPEDPSARNTLSKVWESDVVFEPGLDAMGMIRSAEAGDLRALLLIGVEPFAVFPDTERTRKALSGVDLIVRTAMFSSRGEEVANVLFPSTAMTEADGTFINTEGRVQRISKIVDPPGAARPNARFLIDLAGKLGSAMGFLTAKDVFEEIRTVCPNWTDLSWADMGQRGGVPLPSGDGRDGLRGEQSADKRFVAYPLPESSAPASDAHPDRPWKVIPEETMVHPGDGVVSSRSYRLARFKHSDVARVNPADASAIGVEKGGWVVLRSDVGEAKVKLVLDPYVPPSGIVIPSGGPSYVLQRLISWPDEELPVAWDRIYVSAQPLEE
jgi:formate dehydrogenase (NADP+) alpha subunit